jgi:beta-glucosidase/6-phospho-beta-glucosidase/beta-galactosidase
VSSTDDNNLINKLLVKVWNYFANHFFLNSINGHFDYLGLNYYFHDTIDTSWKKFPFVKISHDTDKNPTDIGWEIFPEGIYHVLNDLKKFNLPIYVTENGIADARDEKRGKFIADHLRWVHKAISEGSDVKGYLHWSLVDNFEWDSGYGQRFGLIEMDFDTLKTKIRPSAYEYAKVCKNNSLII